MTMTGGFSLGEPEFLSTSQLRDYCLNGRNLIRPVAAELAIAEAELFAVLTEVGGADLSRWDRRRRARQVSRHLHHGSKAVEAACASLLRTVVSFERTYLGAEGTSRPRRHFDLGS
jgi:hypothetical protein